MRRDASAKLVRGSSTFVVSLTKAKDGAFAKIRPSQARREGANLGGTFKTQQQSHPWTERRLGFARE
jgi:hypothetical protein